MTRTSPPSPHRSAVAAPATNRRAALGTSLLALLLLAPPTLGTGFSYGVSAGDVTHERVILWTRADAPGEIRLDVATDEAFTQIVFTTVAGASEDADQTIKLDVGNLVPSAVYFYRFSRVDDPSRVSRTGRFRTAPPPDAPAGCRFVYSGDSNSQFSPLVVMGHALEEDPDLFIWFGDVMYGDLGTVATTLDEYRAKYREILSDPYMQDLLAATVTLVGWDDHEVYNDYAGLDPDLPLEQRNAAYQAFFEYLPIRDPGLTGDPYRTYRSFRYGSSIDFILLDERQHREPSAEDACGTNYDPVGFVLGPLTFSAPCLEELAAPRTMLGSEQKQWLKDALSASTATLKFVVNNVPMTYIALYPYDRWDGYDVERRELLEYIDGNGIDGVVFLTTDTHANAHNPDITYYLRNHRPEYALDSGIAMPELIAGPIGTHTLYDELVDQAASITNLPAGPLTDGLIGWLAETLLNRLKVLNGMTFIEPHRMSYARLDATADGRVDVTFRGIHPDVAQDPDATLETLHTSSVVPPPAAPAVPCFWPFLVLAAMACAVRAVRPRAG